MTADTQDSSDSGATRRYRGRHGRLLHRAARRLPGSGPEPAAGRQAAAPLAAHAPGLGRLGLRRRRPGRRRHHPRRVAVQARAVRSRTLDRGAAAGARMPQTVVRQPARLSPGRACAWSARSPGRRGHRFHRPGQRLRPGGIGHVHAARDQPAAAAEDLLGLTSPYHATVGRDGTFRVQVSQLYAGPLQQGEVTVNASAAGRRASTRVHHHPVRAAVRRGAARRLNRAAGSVSWAQAAWLRPRSTTGPPGGTATPGRTAGRGRPR